MSEGWSWLALASAMGHEGATQVLEEHARECFKDWKPADTLKAENPMDEPIPDLLLKVADVLHFLGRYREANVLTLLSRWLRARGIETDEALEAAVRTAERDAEDIAARRERVERLCAAAEPESTETPEPSK